MGMEAFSSWALRAFGLNLFCASPLFSVAWFLFLRRSWGCLVWPAQSTGTGDSSTWREALGTWLARAEGKQAHSRKTVTSRNHRALNSSYFSTPARCSKFFLNSSLGNRQQLSAQAHEHSAWCSGVGSRSNWYSNKGMWLDWWNAYYCQNLNQALENCTCLA